jgi:hypothetical protein
MKRSQLRQKALSRIGIILGLALLAAAGMLALLTLLEPGSAAPVSTEPPATTVSQLPTPEPSPTSPPIAASVNGHTITRSYLERATALNELLSEFAGQESLGRQEALKRLINQEVLLQGTSLENERTDQDVEDYIDRMQNAWDIDEETMMSELAAAGIERDFLEETVYRLLSVQAAVERVESEGHTIAEWLARLEEDADIKIYEDMPEEPLVTAEQAEASPTPRAELPTTASAIQPEALDVAPDFTLNRAGGGSFTLNNQLEEGPVVLVFFEKCG